jgi:hypothetical protein
MDPPVLSFYGTEPVPLPSRFARIKRNLIAGHEAALEASWGRLIEALRSEVDHIEDLGPHLIPSIEFGNIDDRSQTTRFGRDLKRYGVGVVRGVIPPHECEAFERETVGYLETAHDFKPPTPQDPTCFDFYWTPAQIRTRAHPHVIQAQRFMMGLWESTPDDKIATRFPIAYADRIRIHGSNFGKNARQSDDDGHAQERHNATGDGTSERPLPSADDWLSQIASSTIIAQIDNGSLERWEPDGYQNQRGGTYDKVFHGDWDAHDPWQCSGRVSANPDLYNGYGACSIVRLYQGLLALNTIEPGTIRLLPSPKLATAYFLLRPFFSPRRPPPEIREGPEWEAFLAPSNWEINREQSTIVHGAVPGHAQRVTELWHPHLHLRRSLITLPTLHAGDYILWHPDLAYHITSNGDSNPLGLPAAASPSTSSGNKMVVYIPACPLTQNNALYLARQRKTFLRGHPGPDFDSTGSGLGSEAPHAGRLGEKEIAETGGPAGLQGMGLAPWDQAATPTNGGTVATGLAANSAPNLAGADGAYRKMDEDVEMTNGVVPSSSSHAAHAAAAAAVGGAARSSSLHSAASHSHAEAEVVRVANLILFPDRFMMGFPQERSDKGKGRSHHVDRLDRGGLGVKVDGINLRRGLARANGSGGPTTNGGAGPRAAGGSVVRAEAA